MKVSIHISTDMVKVLSYTKTGNRVAVKDFLTYPLPEECVLNGVILDGTPIIDGLRSLKASKPELFKDVSLVIDGSFVYSKKITVPGKLVGIMLDEIIRDEFAEISTDSENLICDHYLLSRNEDTSKDVLACAVEYAHAQAYIEIFKAADIKLWKIHLGIQTVLQFVENRPELKSVPFVLNLVDDVVLLSMIFQNGITVFQSRTRLYGDDRATFVRSTLDGLSGIIQFNKSQNFDDLTNCYYLGMSKEDMDLVALDTSYPDIRFSPLQIYKDVKGAELLPPGAHFVYLNTLVPESKPDLISNMKLLDKAKARKRPRNRWLPVLAGTALFIAIAITVMLLLVNGVESKIREINDHLTSPTVVSQREHLEELDANTTYINHLYSAVADRKKQTEAKPQVSRQLLDTIVRTAGFTVSVNGLSFNADNGTLSVSCSSMNETFPAAFVESLSRNDLIEAVYYTGYSSGADGAFLFTIEIIAKGWNEEVPSDDTGA